MADDFPLSSILGLGSIIGGGIFGASNADKRREQLAKLARTPGVSIPGVYGEALGGAETALPRAAGIASDVNRLGLEDLTSLYETSIPGFREMQRTRAGTTGSLLRGEIPEDVAGNIWRGANARALEGGYGGAPIGRNLAARDLGLTSLNLMNMGGQNLESMIRTTPQPRTVQASDLLLGTKDVLGLRSGERTEKLNLLGQSVNAPGSNDVFANILQGLGGYTFGQGGGLGSIMRAF